MNSFGKVSKLSIDTKYKDNKTIIDNIFFTAPYKVMKPFYLDNNTMKIMILSASAGIMEGDTQSFNFNIGNNTNVEIVSQSYEKIHKMQKGKAIRNTEINVESNSILKYNPLPTIPFALSNFESTMTINLKDNTSKLIYSEILSCGRSARGERFQYTKYKSLVKIYKSNKLIYYDNTINDPKVMDLEALGMYEGFTHLGNMVICNYPEENFVDKIKEIIKEDEEVEGSATIINSGDIVVKVFASNSQRIERVFGRMADSR